MKRCLVIKGLMLCSCLMIFGCSSRIQKSGISSETESVEKSAQSEVLSEHVNTTPSNDVTGVEMKKRPSVLAGRWYPENPEELRSGIEKYLREAPGNVAEEPVRAIVVPHAGHVWSGDIAAAGFKSLDMTRIQRIFILCPNHRVPVHGIVAADADIFETPLGELSVDRDVIGRWVQDNAIRYDDGAHRLEHAIEIQLPFIQVVFKDHLPKIVPLIVGELSSREAEQFGLKLRSELKEDDLIVISSDFVHYGDNYGFTPFKPPIQPKIREYDAQTVEAISKLDGQHFDAFARKNPHAACGINSLRVLSYALEQDRDLLKFEERAHDTSGRKSGDDENSVSYEALIFSGKLSDKIMGKDNTMSTESAKNPLSESAQKTAHEIVRQALISAVSSQHETSFDLLKLSGEMEAIFKQEFGVFVTLNDANGNLRGCIGNIFPVATLGEALWGRAQDAALNDPRFDPVSEDELPLLHTEISVLTQPEPVSGYDKIIIGRHGVVLRKSGRSAVFLPQVAPEQGWTLEEMLMHLSMKAGLSPFAWREGASFMVFEAQVF